MSLFDHRDDREDVDDQNGAGEQWVEDFPDSWRDVPEHPIDFQADDVQIRQIHGGVSMRQGTDSDRYIFSDEELVVELEDAR